MDGRREKQKGKLRKKLKDKGVIAGKSICLVMIVRNEGKNMIRLLDSLLKIIDFVSIVDTGSIDNTVEVTTKWCESNNVPLKFHSRAFTNFGESRTHSYEMAKKSFPQTSYFLLSDADFIWMNNPELPFNKQLLFEKKYLVNQKALASTYPNIRLLSNECEWVCKGVTHEYWSFKNPNEGSDSTRTLLSSLWIYDKEDGGHKGDKYVRDIRLITTEIENNKNIERPLFIRYHFYLAQSYKDLQDYDNAITWYNKRIDLKGWEEEVWFSLYQIGFCKECISVKKRACLVLMNKEPSSLTDGEKSFIKLNNSDNLQVEVYAISVEEILDAAQETYLQAFNLRPSRAEPLSGYVRIAINRKNYEDAYKYILIGKSISLPKNDQMFIEHHIYNFRFDMNLTIVCHFLEGKKLEGQEACQRLLDKMDIIPENERVYIKNNCHFYI